MQSDVNQQSETAFFRNLKLVTTLLIKHGSREYRHLLPAVQANEDRSWETKPVDEQRRILAELRTLCTAEGSIHAYFEAFPHDWTRRKYSEFVDSLNEYCQTFE